MTKANIYHVRCNTGGNKSACGAYIPDFPSDDVSPYITYVRSNHYNWEGMCEDCEQALVLHVLKETQL